MAYYEVVSSKKASLVVESIKRCINAFEKISKHRVHKLSSDAGSEFIHKNTRAYLKKSHIHYDQEAKPRKLIESANRTLRRYVERIGWDTVGDLKELVAKFVETYNDSKHSSTQKIPNDLMRMEEKKDIKDESKRQFNEKSKKVSAGKGYTLAELKVGDKVRIFDPKRKEIKAKQKEELKGKKKFSDDDYVKKFTSKHMGQEAHWTKKIYKIIKIIKGTRAPRYKLDGRKPTFLRSELQKVAPVTKKDPRTEILQKKEQAKKDKRATFQRAHDAKQYAGKTIIVYSQWGDKKTALEDDPAVVLMVYKDYLIVFYTKSKEIDWIRADEVARKTSKKYDKTLIRSWIYDNKKQVKDARDQINKEIERKKAQS